MRRPSVRMMRQPPEYVPSDSAVGRSRITHHGTCEALSWYPPTTSASTIDAHGLLRVLHAVAERHRGGGDGLRVAEAAVEPARPAAAEDPQHGEHQQPGRG